MADCSTPQGKKITQRLLKLKPFMKTSHNSTIHISDGNKFINTLNFFSFLSLFLIEYYYTI